MKLFRIWLMNLFCLSAFSEVANLSDHFDGSRFYNPSKVDKNFFDAAKWWWQRKPAKWPESVEVIPKILEQSSELAVTFVGHSTFFLQVGGINILTDPIWSDRASPVSFAGPKRVRKPGINFEDISRVDVVLISHNHYDHMDLNTLLKIEEKFHPIFITGVGNKKFLENEGLKSVQELDWFQSTAALGINFVFTPAQHFSARGILDHNKTLWGSFVIESPKGKIFFAGDSGYSEHFKKIGEQYGPFRLALIPIGAYNPRWFMATHHTDPSDAVMAHIDLKSQYSVGMHFGTFQLTDESIDQPIIDLKAALEKNNMPKTEFETLDFGETKHLAPF